jgi:hypothetical protein
MPERLGTVRNGLIIRRSQVRVLPAPRGSSQVNVHIRDRDLAGPADSPQRIRRSPLPEAIEGSGECVELVSEQVRVAVEGEVAVR